MASETTASDLSRSDARRRAILDVASEVFLAQGYAAASMSEIATRLGGSKGTLYNYFRSKEELIGALIADTCQWPAIAIFDPLPPIGEGRSVAAPGRPGFRGAFLWTNSSSLHRRPTSPGRSVSKSARRMFSRLMKARRTSAANPLPAGGGGDGDDHIR